MELSALLTYKGINIGFCPLLFSLCSVFSKQPECLLWAEARGGHLDSYSLERFVPWLNWISKDWR